MEMGEIIKMLRLEKGLTQEQLGNLIGVQKSAIRRDLQFKNSQNFFMSALLF